MLRSDRSARREGQGNRLNSAARLSSRAKMPAGQASEAGGRDCQIDANFPLILITKTEEPAVVVPPLSEALVEVASGPIRSLPARGPIGLERRIRHLSLRKITTSAISSPIIVLIKKIPLDAGRLWFSFWIMAISRRPASLGVPLRVPDRFQLEHSGDTS